MTATAIKIQLPRKLGFLLEPHRYKIAKGGRGGVKSWSFARALLLLGSKTPLRILCAREVQKSLKESVHQLLVDQIQELQLEDFYQDLEHEIRGLNGTLIIFSGLSEHTVSSIKSFESIDIVWVEEAQTVSGKSWDILIPTIRKEGSEIWLSFNPELDTDETYVRFVEHTPPNAMLVHTTYRDNPWMTPELEAERAHDEATKKPEDYAHIWEGQCRSALAGAIFANEVAQMVQERRICKLPYDPRLKVHTVWDMGYNTDNMSVGLIQRGLSEVRIIDYMEERYKTVDWFAAELTKKNYNWGFDFLPWDAWVESRQTGKSDAQMLQRFGRRPKRVPNVPDAEQSRIRSLRGLFPQIYVDEVKGARLVECWKRYRRNVPRHGEPSTPIHDQYCHGCDMSGYMSLIVTQMTNEDLGRQPAYAIDTPSPHASMGVFGA